MCNEVDFVRLIYFVKNILDFIYIIVPILLIIMIGVDLGKVVISSDVDKERKKAFSVIIKRCIATVAIFFCPAFIFYLINLTGVTGSNEGVVCWNNANKETIAKLTAAKELEKAKELQKLEISNGQNNGLNNNFGIGLISGSGTGIGSNSSSNSSSGSSSGSSSTTKPGSSSGSSSNSSSGSSSGSSSTTKPGSSSGSSSNSSSGSSSGSSSTTKPGSSSGSSSSTSNVPTSNNFQPFVNGVQRPLNPGECMKKSDNCYCPTVGSYVGFQFTMATEKGREFNWVDMEERSQLVYLVNECPGGKKMGGYVNVNVKDKFEVVFKKICQLTTTGINGVKINADLIKSSGTWSSRLNAARTVCSPHAYVYAIDINSALEIKVNGQTFMPWAGQGVNTRKEYDRFVKALGKENDTRNVNYILWKYVFEPSGFIWGGNWNDGSFDPMHYEVKR